MPGTVLTSRRHGWPRPSSRKSTRLYGPALTGLPTRSSIACRLQRPVLTRPPCDAARERPVALGRPEHALRRVDGDHRVPEPIKRPKHLRAAGDRHIPLFTRAAEQYRYSHLLLVIGYWLLHWLLVIRDWHHYRPIANNQ